MKGKKVFAVLGITSILICSLSGCSLFQTMSSLTGQRKTTLTSEKELESGKAYVLQDGTYHLCITGEYNFPKKELEEEMDYPRSIWISSDEDKQIPTLKSGDQLIFVSKDEVPESFVFERFADYGYTIGVSNLMMDQGGHYYLPYLDVEEEYKYYIDLKSDAKELTYLSEVPKLYLDQVGKEKITKEKVSDGGTVLGLTKDQTYTCEFYTGTYYQDFNLKANIHSFGSMERFISHEYAFMHSNFIAIEIPDYFVSGYYFVNGVGLFRYVTGEDEETYNGKAFDPGIDWNTPMITYNEDGTVKFDPSEDSEEETWKERSDVGETGEVTVDVSLPEEQISDGEEANGDVN
ncbi:hypothetical protein [Mediterraneibacter faecis]|uniref:hypothetical protein n=1 Tax=Mediterraneibacter faecis TaxID=592978 RepID=UPI0018ABD46C|nr:hypothetical protein [Mediterraneibacter faecis]